MQGAGAWVGLVDSERLRRRRLEPGEALFRQGASAVAVYRVDCGRVRLVRHLEDGSSVALHVARNGETFAEAALWAEAYHCDSVAEALSEVTVIPKADLLDALEDNPQAALALARGLAAHVRDLRARLELRNIRSAPKWILAWLRLQASGDPPTARLDRPWTEIAAEIGLTHEAIYRALSTLERTGRIARRSGVITLCRHRDA
ncbi:Crp/Fnr family transcriptional regulator [Azospirillum brasilense]|uniref:Crp/Fnr family transcriptional regulator n=1 Tax=Azospirillum brasilense TaxID=192 RepID=A0A6L3B1Y6_AZOBR|nr:Crp/Fnr family transcriptional regulator [Azospirillum brasilense]